MLSSFLTVFDEDKKRSTLTPDIFEKCTDYENIVFYTFSESINFVIRNGTSPDSQISVAESKKFIDYARLAPYLFDSLRQENPDVLAITMSMGLTGLFTLNSQKPPMMGTCMQAPTNPFSNPLIPHFFRSNPNINPDRIPYFSPPFANPFGSSIAILGLPVYIQNEFKGAIIAQVNTHQVFSEFFTKKPSTNGFYVIANTYGEILSMSDEASALLFDENTTFLDTVKKLLTLQNSTSFKEIYYSIISKTTSKTITSMYLALK